MIWWATDGGGVIVSDGVDVCVRVVVLDFEGVRVTEDVVDRVCVDDPLPVGDCVPVLEAATDLAEVLVVEGLAVDEPVFEGLVVVVGVDERLEEKDRDTLEVGVVVGERGGERETVLVTVSVLLRVLVAVLLEVTLRVLEVVLVFVDELLGEALLDDVSELEEEDVGVAVCDDDMELVGVSVRDDEAVPLILLLLVSVFEEENVPLRLLLEVSVFDDEGVPL